MYDAYQLTPNWTRIEMLIAGYDGTIQRLRKAVGHLRDGREDLAAPLLIRAQRLVTELYAGLDLQHGVIPQNVQKIYIFVLGAIGDGSIEDLDTSINSLETIRSALDSIRDEANQLERCGQLTAANEEVQQIQHAVG